MKKVDKIHKAKIMGEIRKAGSEEYETSWDEKGCPVSKKKSEIKKGRTSRAKGARFELKVREEMESRGWIIDKWSNNVDLNEGKLVKAKRKYNPFKKMLVVGTGFPDFIAFKRIGTNCEVIGVEVKTNGILSKEEKAKCKWLLDNNIFSEVLIAKQGAPKGVPRDIPKEKSTRGKKRGQIDYVNFAEKYNKT